MRSNRTRVSLGHDDTLEDIAEILEVAAQVFDAHVRRQAAYVQLGVSSLELTE